MAKQIMWDSVKLSEIIKNDTRLNAGYYDLDVKEAKVLPVHYSDHLPVYVELDLQ